MHLIKIRLTLCLMILMGTQLMASDLRKWELSATLPGETLTDVCWGEGRFVTVAGANALYYSSDGKQWNQGITVGGFLSHVTYQQDTFFAMGPGVIARSPDGIDWTTVSNTGATGISCHKGMFIAVGLNGNIQQSTDTGLTWQPKTSGTTKNLYATTHWNGYFYAVGEHHTVLISFNGSLWELAHQDTSAGDFTSVIPREDTLLALGGDQETYQSSNAWDWSLTTSQGFEGFDKVKDFGALLAARNSSGMEFSSHGNYWSSLGFHQLPGTPTGMATNGHVWIAVLDTGEIYISKPDHSNRWRDLQQADDINFKDVIWDGVQWVAVGSGGRIGFSTDGSHWKFQSIPGVFSFLGIAYGNSQYVAVGAFGHVWFSSNAVDWVHANSGTTQSLNRVAFNGTDWVAVGWSGTIISATNPANWSTEVSGTTTSLFDVTVDSSGQFWAVGNAGTCIVRDSGATWSPNNLPTASNIATISGTDGTLLWAAGQSGTLYQYTGTNWTWKYSGTTEYIEDICWSESHGITFAGENGIIGQFRTPSDPVIETTFNDKHLHAVASNSVSRLVVGDNGSCGKTAPAMLDQPETVFETPGTSIPVIDILWTGELFVALHSHNRIETSTDGRLWEYRGSIPDDFFQSYKDLHWDGQNLYAVSYDTIHVSQDFSTWTGGDHHLGFITLGMASHNGQLVVVGNHHTVAYGPDIQNLSTVLFDDPGYHTFSRVEWNGFQFHAYGESGTYANSTDGVNWETDTFLHVLETAVTNGYAFREDGASVMALSDGRIFYSPNGQSFEQVANMYPTIGDVVWTGEVFLAIGLDGFIASSFDGINWIEEELTFSGPFSRLAWDGRALLAAGKGRLLAKGAIIRFPMASGYQWGKRKAQINHDIHGLAFNGQHYVSVGLNGRIHVSGNGIDWCEVDSKVTSTLYDVEWIGDRFLAVGESGTVISSPKGIEWTAEDSGATIRFRSVACDGPLLLAAGQNGYIYRSTDKGVNWNIIADLPEEVMGLAFKKETWVAVGSNGMIETSTDVVTWDARASGTSSSIHDVCETKYGFLAVGYRDILESEDGVTWVLNPNIIPSQTLNTVETMGDRIMVGTSQGIWSGNFGFRNFYPVYSGEKIFALLRNDQWVAVGEKGSILVSTWGTSSDKPWVVAANADILSCLDAEVTMEVIATDPSNNQYRWFKGGIELSPGTTHTNTFTINSIQTGDNGAYSCRVWNTGGMLEIFFTLTSTDVFSGGFEQDVYVQGISPVTMMALADCEIHPLSFVWKDLGSQQSHGTANNTFTLPPSVVASTIFQVTIMDSVTLDSFQDTAPILIANDSLFFNLNGDSCNDLQDLYFALEEWRQPSSLDANSDGQFNLLDFLYINLDGCD